MTLPGDPRPKRASRPIANRLGDVQMEKLGVRRFDLSDPYHLAVTTSWPQFLACLLAVYMAVNTGFALLYWLQPGGVANARPGSFFDVFFFSIETLATVGYGAMTPSTAYAHIVSAVEIFVGMVMTATMTGLVFVRFSRPRAKMLFAESAVIARLDGVPTLMLRIGNGRANMLMDAHCRITLLLSETDAGGRAHRRALNLPLVRSEFALFPLTWTVMHEVAPGSPLAPWVAAGCVPEGTQLYVSVSARDPALQAQVYDNALYSSDDIALGMRYVDAVHWDGASRSVADMRKISHIEPDDSAATHAPPAAA